MPDRIKLRRGSKSKIDLNVYELGYVTDPNEQRLYFNNGSIIPIPNNKDITDIKTELTKTTNISNKNKQDISYLKDSIDGISATGSVRLVQRSYDISLSGSTKKVNIPYEWYSSVTDTLKVYVNGLAIQNDQYEITDPVEHDGTVTKGYIMLNIERPAGTIVRIEVWKNVPCGEEGAVNGNIIARNSLPLDRIIGLNDNTNKYEVAGGTATAITLNMPATLQDGYWKKFIASGDNGGTPTTINGKSVYKVSTTNPPRFKKDRPYEVYYNAAKNCFFLKASATGTTSADKVLAGETFSTENDTDLVGTMPNKGAVTASLNCGGSYTIPAGYHNGSGKVTANSLASQTSANATAGNIISGKTAWVNGKKITGTATIKSLGGITAARGTISPSYDLTDYEGWDSEWFAYLDFTNRLSFNPSYIVIYKNGWNYPLITYTKVTNGLYYTDKGETQSTNRDMWLITYKTHNKVTFQGSHNRPEDFSVSAIRIIGDTLVANNTSGGAGHNSRTVRSGNKIVQFISKYYSSAGQPNDDQNYSRGFNYTGNKDTESYTYIAYE